MVVMLLSKVSSRFSREGFRRPSDREDIVYQDRAQLGLVSVVGCPSTYLNTGYYLRLNAAHQVALYPLAVVYFFTVLLVVPADEATSAEAGRIDGKIGF